MSQEHPNATAYREAADAFRAGDLRAVEAVIDPDVVWHVPGKHRRAGDILGRDALLAWLSDLATIGFWLREHDVFGNDEHVCALSDMGARREGLEVETRVVSIFHFRNGRQIERWFFPEDTDAWNRIFDA
jgi:ketosteroid isomerase-like protein